MSHGFFLDEYTFQHADAARSFKPSTHSRRRRDATAELSRVGGVYGIRSLVGDSFDESEQICQPRVELRREGRVNAPVGSRRELVANCVHTADADTTQLDSCVALASAVCTGHYSDIESSA